MTKRKFITFILVAIMSIFCLSGCKKAIHTETTVVEATVVDIYHKNSWTQYVWTGKTMTVIYHKAKYKVTLQYVDYKTTVDNKDLYDQCKDNIGAIVECNLVTTYYEDGTAEIKLKWENSNE